MATRILVGDAVTVLRTLPSASVHVVCTSPPYFQLRDYQVAGQIGLERNPDEYVTKLVEVFAEVKRVLRPDGTLWLNIADSMAGSGKGKTGHNGIGDQEHRQGFHDNYHLGRDNQTRARWPSYGKPKDLLLIPFRLALALQADGWYVRSDIAWCKRSCMPESVQDRPTNAWEHVFLLSKAPRYFYDSEAVREEGAGRLDRGNMNIGARLDSGAPWANQTADEANGRNMRNVWLLGPEPFSEAHFATFVPEIPRRAILAGTSERGCCAECGAPWVRVVERTANGWHESPKDAGRRAQGLQSAVSGLHGQYRTVESVDHGWRPSCKHEGEPVPATVLDCFGGAGTTALVADRLGRNAILVELNPEYAAMAQRRINGESPMFSEVSVA